jgi:hypothetical protein
MREGDLIEAIDGSPATRTSPLLSTRKEHTLTVVRDRQRFEISVELKLEKQP